ncbi:MAG: aminopeptidase [Atopobium sp.]|nr:aminopeptidase [Atopobium sp.]
MKSIPMTSAECKRAMEGLSRQIDNYADLLVRIGAAVRPGQELVVSAPVERADFARKVVRSAYKAQASHVTMIWTDDQLKRLDYLNVDIDWFRHVPEWKKEQLNSLAKAGASFLFLEGSDPSAFAGVDPIKPAIARRASNLECKAFRDGMDFGRNVWCIAGVPVRDWACKVFPDVCAEEAVYRLWLAILEAARSDGDDPQSAWETHNAAFEKNKRILNDAHYDCLRYSSSNGTDFTIGLNQKGIWEGGAGKTQDGTVFFPNIPTEEVFTTPDRLRAEGVVHSALPLVYNGQIIRDFWFSFKDGKVVDYDAAEGRETLAQILETDSNSSRLGECALISKNTPIRQSGLLFYDTLYDENASCHLALGMGFPECVSGGFELDKNKLLAHGVNQSAVHVDFMVGSDDLCVTGIKVDGTQEPVFVNGQWMWECE